MPGGMASATPELEAEELAWLATLPDVESRLVFTERSGSKCRYRLEQGPFTDDYMASLPDSDWTLLVQDVDKHLPAFREFFASVAFIPDWRLDDLMVSFASPGGSVGPHEDNYDVFLCQGMGERDWRLAARGSGIPASDDSGLSLLQAFTGDAQFQCRTGDVLYLPPGVPHWGIARNACMTSSIGLRAPDAVEMRLAAERLFAPTVFPPSTDDQAFYTDPDLVADAAAPGEITATALRRARASFPFASSLSDHEFAQLFGSVVTDPKAWLAPEGVSAAEARNVLRGDRPQALTVHGMAKLAWCDSTEHPWVFVNGLGRPAGKPELALFCALCGTRQIDARGIRALIDLPADDALRSFVAWLLEQGGFDAESLAARG